MDKLPVDFSSSEVLNSSALSVKGTNRFINKWYKKDIFLTEWGVKLDFFCIWCRILGLVSTSSNTWNSTCYIATTQHSEQFVTYSLKWGYEYMRWCRNAILPSAVHYARHSFWPCKHLDNKGSIFHVLKSCTMVTISAYFLLTLVHWDMRTHASISTTLPLVDMYSAIYVAIVNATEVDY